MESTQNKTMKSCGSCGAEIAKSAKSCPQCGAKNKKPIYKRVWFIALIAVVIIAVAVNATKGQNTNPDAQAAASAAGTAAQAETPQDIEYTAYDVAELMNDLDANAMKAENKYNKANVEITGRLNTIDSDGKYISLVPTNEQYAIIGVQCYLKDDEQKAKVMEMSVGDTVVLKGQIKDIGEILGYTLNIDSIS
jgi:hypothetical protein